MAGLDPAISPGSPRVQLSRGTVQPDHGASPVVTLDWGYDRRSVDIEPQIQERR